MLSFLGIAFAASYLYSTCMELRGVPFPHENRKNQCDFDPFS